MSRAGAGFRKRVQGIGFRVQRKEAGFRLGETNFEHRTFNVER